MKARMSFVMLIGTINSLLSLLPEVKKMTSLVEGNQPHMFLRNAGFDLVARNPFIVRLNSFLDIWNAF